MPTFTWSSPIFADGNLTVAQPCSLPALSSPIPVENGSVASFPTYSPEYLLTQDWIQYRANYAPLALNTVHPDFNAANGYANFHLVAEGERRDIGGGLVRWSRTYAAIPAGYDEYESYSYSFIGLLGVSGTSYIAGRNRTTRRVISRVRHDFYIVDPTRAIAGSVYSPADIALVYAMPYCAQWVSGGATYGGTFAAADVLGYLTLPTYQTGALTAPSGSSYPANYPAYEYLVANAITLGWNATTTNIVLNSDINRSVNVASSTWGGQLPAEDSQLVRWNGNIWQRISRYVLAQ